GPRRPPRRPEDPSDHNPEFGEASDEEEEIERYLNDHYRRIKKKYDKDTGQVVPSNERWLDIEKRRIDGGGYMGMTPEYQKSLLGIAIGNQIDLTRSQRVVIRAFDGAEEFKTYFQARRDMISDKLRAEGKLGADESVSINDVYKAVSSDVKDIVRELLSNLSGTVDQANSKESRYIDQLIDRISRNIRTEITGDTDMDIPGTIHLDGTDAFLPSEIATSSNRGKEEYLLSGGMMEYLVPRNVRVSLSEALVDDLGTTLAKLKKITFGFNNARAGAYSLSSHEELAELIKKRRG
ncbi:MAG: hypothetical protein UZ22_OP11002000338, partial [Microgenomates bacterium OLB23]